jgi:hypothetical protein
MQRRGRRDGDLRVGTEVDEIAVDELRHRGRVEAETDQLYTLRWAALGEAVEDQRGRLCERLVGQHETTMDHLEARLPAPHTHFRPPMRPHEHQPLLPPAHADASGEPQQCAAQELGAGFLAHLASQGVAPVLMRLRAPRGQPPPLAIAADQDDPSVSDTPRLGATRRTRRGSDVGHHATRQSWPPTDAVTSRLVTTNRATPAAAARLRVTQSRRTSTSSHRSTANTASPWRTIGVATTGLADR